MLQASLTKLFPLALGFAFLSLATATPGNAEGLLRVFPAPAGITLHEGFAVRVRVPGGSWQNLPVYDVRVNLSNLSQAGFAYFDFSGKVEVEINCAQAVQEVAIRPVSCAITPVRVGNTITFTLDRPMNLSIEINDDRLHNLHLFASAPEMDIPSSQDRNVIFFGPGVHKLGTHPAITSEGKIGGQDQAIIRVSSVQTVFLAGGSVVQAAIKLDDNAQNVTICGRGILDLSPWNEPDGHHIKNHTWQTPAITLPFASHVRIAGIIIKQPTGYSISGGQAQDIAIDNLKSFSAHEWSDGIDMMSSSNIRIANVFMRNSDDCIAIYGSRWRFRGDSRNWRVTDSTFWADKAHPVYIGVHGDFQGEGDILEDLQFHNIDILESNEKHEGFLGALSIGCGDKNTCRNILFEDIRVENILPTGRLLDLQFKHYSPSTLDGRSIQNIVFRKINCFCPRESFIEGKNPEQQIQGVLIEELRIAGHPIGNAKDASLTIGNFVTGVKIK